MKLSVPRLIKMASAETAAARSLEDMARDFIHAESHLDHGVFHVPEAKKLILEHLEGLNRAGTKGLDIHTIDLPEHLGLEFDNALHGPRSGDAPILDEEAFELTRKGRDLPNRVVERAPRKTRKLTIISGPHDGRDRILYTTHGGPAAERNPLDPSLAGDPVALEKAKQFWAEHALSAPTGEDALEILEGSHPDLAKELREFRASQDLTKTKLGPMALEEGWYRNARRMEEASKGNEQLKRLLRLAGRR